MNKQDTASKLDELQAKHDKLFNQFLELRAQRRELKKALLTADADFGCECDSDYCHTEKYNEPISAGKTDRYCHDDQDAGFVSVYCVSGAIEVVIYRAVWSKFVEYDRKSLEAGQRWSTNIDEADSWYDQTNRIDVIGQADSVYNLDFKSWAA